MRMHLSCSCDADYAPHAAAMISSALGRRGANEMVIHLLHDASVTPAILDQLHAMIRRQGGSFDPHEIPADWVDGLPRWDYISPAMWFRIFLPELLPDVDRILYLDVDTIVLASLDDMFATDLDGSYVAAVSNVVPLPELGRISRLGLDDPRDYFNSGVLLMNLDLMRRDGCSRKLHEFGVANGGDLLWPDQDTLNIVLGERRRRLHPRWNLMTSILFWEWCVYAYGAQARNEAVSDPAIRHFEGPGESKPWHARCETPHRELYFAYRRTTPWPDVAIEGSVARARAARAARDGPDRIRRIWRQLRS